MKARELLRKIADRLDALAAATIFAGGCMPEDAAALRELAARWDEEERDARKIADSLPGTSAALLAMLARLDASLQEDKT